MARRSSIRASDEDRERVIERLRGAAGEGRLHAHELEERTARALRARTYGELDPLVSDLPGTRVQRRRPATPHSWVGPAIGVAVAGPMIVAAIAVAVAVVTVAVTMWIFWMMVAWAMFGRRPSIPRYLLRRRRRPPGLLRAQAYVRGYAGARRPPARSGFRI